MKRKIVLVLISAAVGLSVMLATDAARAADEWGLPDEKVVRFDAKVVDVLCELTGDCPTNCGGGKRQLALMTDEGNLVLPVKNVVPFAGAAAELIEFCGKLVTADGLMTTNRGVTIFALQFVRQAPAGKWRRANRFLPQWAKTKNFAPGGAEAKQWFRNDPVVVELIKRQGKLGLGPE